MLFRSHILKQLKPDILFSKGGFVSVPVVLAASRCHIPVIIHESDMTPGLANRLSFPFSSKICCNFPETVKMLPEGKAVLTGSPIRSELRTGNRTIGLNFAHLSGEKPVILVMGGSQGASAINKAVRSILPKLLNQFQIIHICGKDNLEPSLQNTKGYIQFEYIKAELKDIFAATDLMISRAGANSICEILALRKPNILIPLSKAASRGDQILNAQSFQKQGFSNVIEEENLTDELLYQTVKKVYQNRKQYIEAMEKSELADSISIITSLIQELSQKNHK